MSYCLKKGGIEFGERNAQDPDRNRGKRHMDKTVVVAVENFTRHSLYHKVIRYTKKYKAHDEKNECKVGDKVKIMETRPLSKGKCWRVVQIIEKAPLV